jgi:hypothetical protein
MNLGWFCISGLRQLGNPPGTLVSLAIWNGSCPRHEVRETKLASFTGEPRPQSAIECTWRNTCADGGLKSRALRQGTSEHVVCCSNPAATLLLSPPISAAWHHDQAAASAIAAAPRHRTREGGGLSPWACLGGRPPRREHPTDHTV